MDEKTITALAREYAEESASIMQGSLTTKIQAELVIRFLLRTHCIVSKEKVNEAYQKALNQIAGGRGYDIPRIESYGTGKRKLLESLFPEIGKEVEG